MSWVSQAFPLTACPPGSDDFVGFTQGFNKPVYSRFRLMILHFFFPSETFGVSKVAHLNVEANETELGAMHENIDC